MRFELDRPDAPTSGADGATADLFGQDLLPGLGDDPCEADNTPTAAASSAANSTGEPMQLPVHTIDEHPQQPRNEFDADALQQLADTIAQRGVRQPVSVRPHPDQPGRWLLNFGARRLRASKLAGRAQIPAFVDTTADSYDQVIENEQRQGLKPLELALFVQGRLAAGDSKAEVARRLGKSAGYVTQVCALIDAPAWLLAAYRNGQCRGITELYELRRLQVERPQAVASLLAMGQPVTRAQLAGLRAASTEPARTIEAAESALTVGKGAAADATLPAPAPLSLPMPAPSAPMPLAEPGQPSRPVQRLRLEVEHDGQRFELVVDQRPQEQGMVFIRLPAGGGLRSIAAADAKLMGFSC